MFEMRFSAVKTFLCVFAIANPISGTSRITIQNKSRSPDFHSNNFLLLHIPIHMGIF